MGIVNEEGKDCIYKQVPQRLFWSVCKEHSTEIFTVFADEVSRLMRKVSRRWVNLMLMRAETIYHGQSLFKYSYSKNRPKLSDHARSGLEMK